jgi:diguanylate cyclase (GGDEF)-like protein
MLGKKPVILIVDDMASNIEILDGVLSPEFEILFATGGKEAIEIAGDQLPDIILLDIVMPGIDGYEVCNRLKSEEKTRDIPIVFVTAMNQEEDESKGLNAGVVDYITKPIRSSIVRARVHNHLELKRYRDFLKAQSSVDGLTGIFNRRRFDETLNEEWRRARRNQKAISLLMMDIDFFKAYNDHYGHLAGDDCLRKMAKELPGIVHRPADLVARYGGEEFVILLPETDSDGTLHIANRVQEKLKVMNIPHAYSSVADHVTLSIGAITLIPTDELTPFDLIQRADELLYEAKQNGRNMVVSRMKEPA